MVGNFSSRYIAVFDRIPIESLKTRNLGRKFLVAIFSVIVHWAAFSSPLKLCLEILLKRRIRSCLKMQYHADFFRDGSVILKINLCTSQRNKPNIHISYDCLDIYGGSLFSGFGEATKQIAENDAHRPKQIKFTDLYTILQLGLFS